MIDLSPTRSSEAGIAVPARECPGFREPDRILIWKFEAAPFEFQALHHGAETPKWLAWVPQSIHGADVDAVLRRDANVSYHLTVHGDVVYVG